MAKRLRAISPDFVTPFFYFKPYPGTSLTEDAVKNGFSLPCSLDEWLNFDFVGSIGPWVSPEKYRRIERFKFYQQVAWDHPKPLKRPMQKLAQWRCKHDYYALPVEKIVTNLLRPAPRLA